MVYSASLVVAYNEFHDDTYFLIRQLIWIALGVVALAILARLDYHRWQRFSLLGLLIGIALLALVLIPELGVRSYGSARWIRVGPLFQLQPSELIKLALVMYMADWLARKGKRVGEFLSSSLPFTIILSVICGLVVVEPDFGTTVIIAATAISIFFIAGANILHFTPVVSLMVGGFWFVMTRAGYRNQRIDAWFDPWQDSQGAGWHTIQTLIALGSGGLTGLGLGASRQKHSWLVNAHTDAIMAIVGEELGLVGCVGILALFGTLAWRGFLIAWRAPDAFARLFATGLTCMLTVQMLVNVAVVTNSLPYTGVTLPLVSFGGSSTVISLVAIGLLLNISRQPAAALQVDAEPADEPLPPAPPHVDRTLRRRVARIERRQHVVASSSPLRARGAPRV
jgi:cell division protein FtsW